MSKTAAGRYAFVKSLKMYYEIHGTGEPLVLLHGGVGASEMFGPLLPVLAERRQVIAVHLQAHGRTADIDRPLRFELMAEDIAALVKQLGIERADVVGYSLGGGVALRTAIQHREVVRRLVLISTPFTTTSSPPALLTVIPGSRPCAAGSRESLGRSISSSPTRSPRLLTAAAPALPV